MDLRPQIASLIDAWARDEHRATFLSEPLHDRCKRNLVDRLETLLRQTGVSTVPETTPVVAVPRKADAPVEDPGPPGTPSMDELKARMSGRGKGKKKSEAE